MGSGRTNVGGILAQAGESIAQNINRKRELAETIEARKAVESLRSRQQVEAERHNLAAEDIERERNKVLADSESFDNIMKALKAKLMGTEISTIDKAEKDKKIVGEFVNSVVPSLRLPLVAGEAVRTSKEAKPFFGAREQTEYGPEVYSVFKDDVSSVSSAIETLKGEMTNISTPSGVSSALVMLGDLEGGLLSYAEYASDAEKFIGENSFLSQFGSGLNLKIGASEDEISRKYGFDKSGFTAEKEKVNSLLSTVRALSLSLKLKQRSLLGEQISALTEK